MSDQSRDRIDGMTDELKGRGKAAWGELTDDGQWRLEGQADREKGKFEQKKADAKEKVDEVVKQVTGDW
jgi:uncharacterized protein YjbJ (UPF0337 family)